MKRFVFITLAITAAFGSMPIANAANSEPISLQQRRYGVLDRGGSKSVAVLESFLKEQQVSTPEEISEDATFHDLVQYNRRVRDKK